MGFGYALDFLRFKQYAVVDRETRRTEIYAQLLCKYHAFYAKRYRTVIVKHASLYRGIIGHKVELGLGIKEKFVFAELFGFAVVADDRIGVGRIEKLVDFSSPK